MRSCVRAERGDTGGISLCVIYLIKKIHASFDADMRAGDWVFSAKLTFSTGSLVIPQSVMHTVAEAKSQTDYFLSACMFDNINACDAVQGASHTRRSLRKYFEGAS